MTAKEEVLKQIDEINTILLKEMNTTLNEYGKKHLLKLIKNHSYENVVKALNISIKEYFVLGDDDSMEDVINKLDGILYTMSLQNEIPELYDINYLIKIVKNRTNVSGIYLKNIKDYLLANYTSSDFENLKDIFCNYGGYTPLMNQLEIYYGKE